MWLLLDWNVMVMTMKKENFKEHYKIFFAKVHNQVRHTQKQYTHRHINSVRSPLIETEKQCRSLETIPPVL